MEDNTHIYRILILGPESTGKTQLAQELAKHYHTVWVPEFARSYLDAKVALAGMTVEEARTVTIADVMPIALGQAIDEQSIEENAQKFVFCDAGIISTQVYAQHYLGVALAWLAEAINRHLYDFCLLTAIDIPWKEDWQRDVPYQRDALFERFENVLIEQNIPYRIITGMGDTRTKNAIQAIAEWMPVSQ